MQKAKVLKRDRINKALTRIFDYPLTIVEAPMGYGKTTAVKEFLAQNGGLVLWVSFLTSDDTVSFFWDRVVQEISKFNQATGSRLKSLGFPADAVQTANILSLLNDWNFTEKTVLVIDDYHFVRNRQISDLLAQVAREELDNFHIVVITRDTTNLDLAELMAKGLCCLISQSLLRFTAEEIRDYCAMLGYRPAASDLAGICEYTGGWISLVYLILLGLEKDIPIGLNSAIDELVEKVLYNAYDRQIKHFLLRLAVLDSFTAEQAFYVTQERRTDEFLKKLRKENAFITYDETTGFYKIHNVLLDFLRAKTKEQPELKVLFLRAGEWRLQQKEYVAAYAYFYRAGETERILDLLNNEHMVTNAFAEFDGSWEMFATLPGDLLFRYPIAYLQYIGLLLLSGNAGMAEDGAERLAELQAHYEGLQNIPANQKNRILAEINVIRIFAVFNDVAKMLACAAEALRLLEGGHSWILKRENECTFGCPHFLYSYYKEAGKLKQTVDLMVSGFPALPGLADGCGTGCEHLTLTEYALETGNWQDAERNAWKAIYKARTKEQTGIVISANFALIRLYILQGKTFQALELWQQLRRDVVKENSPIYNTTLDLCQGYIYGCLEQPEKIPLWLQSWDISSFPLLYQGLAFNYIVYGKAIMLSGNYLELEILTESCLQNFAVFHNQLGFLHNQIYTAVAKYHLYGWAEGKVVLQKALAKGQADHLILPFAENGSAILDMLKSVAREERPNEYLRAVISACEQYRESLKQVPVAKITLSARELEVLTLAAQGLKRDEIARRLTVSTGTVRTHLQNIYQKLEVGGRAAAVNKALKLKML